MAVASMDLHKNIVTAWVSADLDDVHTAFWPSGADSTYSPLYEAGAAAPGTPFPFTVYEELPASIIQRMSGTTGTSSYITREVPWMFRVRAQQVTGSALSAKNIAANVAEEIMKVFGGHPTQSPGLICLDNGAPLNFKYINDRSIAEGEDSHMIELQYQATLDVPVEN